MFEFFPEGQSQNLLVSPLTINVTQNFKFSVSWEKASVRSSSDSSSEKEASFWAIWFLSSFLMSFVKFDKVTGTSAFPPTPLTTAPLCTIHSMPRTRGNTIPFTTTSLSRSTTVPANRTVIEVSPSMFPTVDLSIFRCNVECHMGKEVLPSSKFSQMTTCQSERDRRWRLGYWWNRLEN